MKTETAQKLKELIENNRIEFEDVPEGLAVNHDLTDAELEQFVQLEYGQITQPVVELFTVICKKAVKLAMEKAKDGTEV